MGTESPQRVAVRRALDGLKPYLEAFVGTPVSTNRRTGPPDIAALLKEMLTRWETRFARELPSVARSYVHELLDVRNRWAHEQPFSTVDADRAVDTVRHLARLIGAPEPKVMEEPVSSQPVARAGLVSPTPKWSGQRETMRRIYRRVGKDEARAIAEYAAAERAGLVLRKTNRSGYTPEEYAKALLSDGLRKGWLRQE